MDVKGILFLTVSVLLLKIGRTKLEFASIKAKANIVGLSKTEVKMIDTEATS